MGLKYQIAAVKEGREASLDHTSVPCSSLAVLLFTTSLQPELRGHLLCPRLCAFPALASVSLG